MPFEGTCYLNIHHLAGSYFFVSAVHSIFWELTFLSCQTYTGNILIAINPFAKLPHLYDNHMMEQYRGAPLGELSPHVFAVADSSYRYSIQPSHSSSVSSVCFDVDYIAFLYYRWVKERGRIEEQCLRVDVQFNQTVSRRLA